MDNPKIREIVQKFRLRDEYFDESKKRRHVRFWDMPKPKEENVKNSCIFNAKRIRERSEEWPEQQKERDIFKIVLAGLQNHEMNDMAISFGCIVFNCPLILLDCFSNAFRNNADEEILHIKPKTFAMIYNWMLTEAIQSHPGLSEIDNTSVLEMLSASKQLKITHLEDQCWYFLQKTAECNEHVAFELYKKSDYNLKEIQQLMLSRVCKFFLTLVSSEDYLNLNIEEVCTLLSSNTLGVNTEMEVFYAAVLWLNYNWNERKGDHLRKVIGCIRFSLMPPWFLMSLKERKDTEEIDRITEQQFVANLITDAIIFTATQLSYLTGNYKPIDKDLEQLNGTVPAQRRWIYDKSCGYHYHRDVEYMEILTYKMFKRHLKCLKDFGVEYWRTLDYASPDHCVRVWKSRPKIQS